MTTYLRRSAALAAVAALFLALPGCIFSPDPGDDVGGTPKPLDYPWPSTEIQLMENFKTAYGGRDIFPYIGSMGENPVYPVLYNDADSEDAYKFRFSQQDMEDPELGLTTDILTYDEEVAIATRMFSGASSTQEGADGAAITDIDFSTLDITTPWESVPATDKDFPNSRRADFDVKIVFSYTDNSGKDGTFTVESLQRFYVKSMMIEQGDGTAKLRWYLYGQEDLSDN